MDGAAQPGFASFLQAGAEGPAEGMRLLLVMMTWVGCRGRLLMEPGRRRREKEAPARSPGPRMPDGFLSAAGVNMPSLCQQALCCPRVPCHPHAPHPQAGRTECIWLGDAQSLSPR